MNDFLWGLQMMAVGMGVVFGLLLLLMLALIVVGRLDEKALDKAKRAERESALAETQPEASAASAPTVTVDADGLDDDTLAAIAIAVITHADVRRRSASPEMRAVEPGSQIFASRWLAVGRGQQTQPFQRR